MIEDLYRSLNLNEKATSDDIHQAYRALAMRYHPDRNLQGGAETLMASINRAYEVLSEPGRRAEYDKAQERPEAHIRATVAEAAREVLLKRSWTLVQEDADEITLKNGSRRVHVLLAPSLNSTMFDEFHRRSAGFCTVLAVRVQPPVTVPPRSAVVVDIMHSRIYGGDFPDTAYKDLFKPFLGN